MSDDVTLFPGTTPDAINKQIKEDTNLIFRSPSSLKPYPKNPRTHSEAQIQHLINSVSEFGFTAPVLTDEKFMILAGHARVEAAKSLKIKKVPVRVIKDLSESQKRAYVIADNKIALQADWDLEILEDEFQKILADEYDIGLTAFEMPEVDFILQSNENKESELEEDNPQNLDQKDCENVLQITKPGDLWILGGRHRLLCGDALEQESYTILMDGKLAQMVITDPPYNVKTKGHIRVDSDHKEFMMAAGEMNEKEFANFLATVMACISVVSQNGCIAYYFMDWRHIPEIMNAGNRVYGRPKQVCVWVKNNGGMGTFYRSQHEKVFVFKKGDAPHINNFGLGENGRYRTNVWSYAGVNTFKSDRDEELEMHPTVKPVDMIADAMLDCSELKGIVLDPFMGSGTSIIAAEKTGRICYGMELDPQYVDVCLARWQRLYDKPVIHAKSGKTLKEVIAERTEGEDD